MGRPGPVVAAGSTSRTAQRMTRCRLDAHWGNWCRKTRSRATFMALRGATSSFKRQRQGVRFWRQADIGPPAGSTANAKGKLKMAAEAALSHEELLCRLQSLAERAISRYAVPASVTLRL